MSVLRWIAHNPVLTVVLVLIVFSGIVAIVEAVRRP